MRTEIVTALRMTLVTLVLTGLVYPLLVAGIAQALAEHLHVRIEPRVDRRRRGDVVVDPVAAGVEPRHEGRARRAAVRRAGVGLVEAHAFARQAPGVRQRAAGSGRSKTGQAGRSGRSPARIESGFCRRT